MITSPAGSFFASASPNFLMMRDEIIAELLAQPVIHTKRWQQLDISDGASAFGTHEMLNTTIWYDMPETVIGAQRFIEPDLPWAEGHFQERVGGKPVNPGEWHDRWPYHAHGAGLHLRDDGKYDHNYMERFWCARGLEVEPTVTGVPDLFTGYRFSVGDLGHVVKQLQRDPTTRQAYLPVWFPEDTGATARQRVPCSLGYHFIIRDGKLHVSYWLRSCEIYRHFTNDVYMAVRLGQWMRNEVEAGLTYTLGQLSINIVSLHAFVGDLPQIHRMMTDA